MDLRKIQDVVPPKGRSIRKVSLPKRDEPTPISVPVSHREVPPRTLPSQSQRIAPVEREEVIEDEVEVEPEIARNRIDHSPIPPRVDSRPMAKSYANPLYESPRMPVDGGNSRPSRKRSGFTKKLFGGVLVFACCALIFAAVSLIYARATVYVTPKTQDISTNKLYTAKKDAGASEIQYEVMSLSKVSTTTVAGSVTPTATTKTKGTVTIYNTYSTGPQTLVATTRFEDTRGRIYRLDSTVTVPGKKVVNGTEVAGSIAARVTADKAGSEYNASLKDLTGDFKLPGYVGSPKYTGFYARMKTDFTGGASGYKVTVAPALASSTDALLTSSLLGDLLMQARLQTPENYVLFPKAYTIQYEPVVEPQTTGSSTVVIGKKATLNAIIFNKPSLLKFLVPAKTAEDIKNSYTSPNLDMLDFAITNPAQFNPTRGTSLSFSLSGIFTIVGSYDASIITGELVGTPLADATQVFVKYGTIANAEVVMKPFWKRTFPNTAEKISIVDASERTAEE